MYGVDTQSADYPDDGADEDDTCPGRDGAIGEGIENRGARDGVYSVPTCRRDHRENDNEEVSPVTKGIATLAY